MICLFPACVTERPEESPKKVDHYSDMSSRTGLVGVFTTNKPLALDLQMLPRITRTMHIECLTPDWPPSSPQNSRGILTTQETCQYRW